RRVRTNSFQSFSSQLGSLQLGSFQLGIGDSGEAAKRGKEFGPFRAQGGDFFLSGGREAIATAATSVGAGLPGSANPTLPFHAIKHRVKSGEREAKRTFGVLFDAAGDFVAMERAGFEDAEDGEFGGAAFDARGDHDALL